MFPWKKGSEQRVTQAIRHGFIYISTLMIFLVWRSIRRVQMANKQCSILAVDGVEAGVLHSSTVFHDFVLNAKPLVQICTGES